ncbi:MAG: EAL domain-containing protein [Gammaproteobacteria bacterium]|nr:EAL domain-containing protein [Gammaproteobacteria bacterium]
MRPRRMPVNWNGGRTWAVVATPFAVLLLMAALVAHYQTQRQADNLIQSLSQHANNLISDSQRQLQLLARVQNQCDPATLQLLRTIPYNHPAIREAAVIVDSALACTSWGLHPSPLPINNHHAQWQEGQWVLYQLRGSAFEDRDVHSLVIGLGLDERRGVNLLLDPLVLLQPLQAQRGFPFSGRLALANGELLVAVISDDGQRVRLVDGASRRFTDTPYQRQQQAGNDQLLASIAISPRLWLNNLLALLPLFIMVGLLFSVAGLWLVRLLRRPPSLRAALLRGLERGEFHVAYLPTIELATGRCVGAEALLRWHHPQQGAMAPDVFVPFAERTGLILPLTEWLLQRALAELGPWLAADDRRHLAINLCARHFESTELLVSLRRECTAHGIAPAQLLLELTEREVLNLDEHAVRGVLTELHASGYRLAIDDFGIGYNNLARLMEFRFDQIKIDKSLIQAIGRRDGVEPLIDGALTIARGYGSVLVAEGVETSAQAEFLAARGVTLVQGYHFAQPLDATNFFSWLATRYCV